MSKLGGMQQNSIVLHDGSAVTSGHTLIEVLVPDADMGLIIGKMGGTFVRRFRLALFAPPQWTTSMFCLCLQSPLNSPPVGTPNPYGVNPNGIAPPPTAAPVAPTAEMPTGDTTSAGADVVTAKSDSVAVNEEMVATTCETSRRHVSNLPAWMTKKS